MRDKLIELLKRADAVCDSKKQCEGCVGFGKGADCVNYHITDYLLANGVIVPPCKVGDKLYFLLYDKQDERKWFISEETITEVGSKGFFLSGCYPPENDMSIFEPWDVIGKTAFKTKEEAEQALKGGEG